MLASKVIRWKQLQTFIPASRTTVWRWVRAGHFPSPLRLGPGIVGWLESDIHAWLERRRATGGGDA